MKRLIIIFTLIVIVLSAVTSVLGALTFRDSAYRTVESYRGETVEILDEGLYRYATTQIAGEGIAWDAVRIVLLIPVLIVSFVLYLKGSLRGALVFIGMLASFFYQYLLWAIGWPFNPLFLAYVVIEALALTTVVLTIASIDPRSLAGRFDRVPSRGLAWFTIAVGAMLLLLWLKEIVPATLTSELPPAFRGLHTMFVQAVDLGLIVPFSLFTGTLLLSRNVYGYLLSGIGLMFMISMGLVIVAGVVLAGIRTGRMDFAGLGIFVVVTGAAAAFLVTVLRRIPAGSFGVKPSLR
jgi:hypothetical protein